MEILELVSYGFFIKAISASFFASIVCGIIGTYIVSRRIVFISGGISHASFGGIGLGYYFGFDPVLGAAIFCMVSAVLVQFMEEHFDIRNDSLIGIMWSVGMAAGIILIYMTPGYAPDMMSYLFGDILTVRWVDVAVIAGITLLVSLVFYFWYREILYISFDEEFMKSQKIKTRVFNYVLICLVALVIVTCIRLVGIILVISLLTVPQAIAEIFTGNFKYLMFLSGAAGFLSCIIGLVVSSIFGIPSGATIIFSMAVLFLLLKLIFRTFRERLRVLSSPG